ARLLVLVLPIAGLPVGAPAQSGPVSESAPQAVVLSYFHDVLDGRKSEPIERLFRSDCALHFGSSDVQGVAGVQAMVERQKTTYSSLTTEIHDIFESGNRVVVRLTHRATGGGVLRSRMGTHDIK